MMENENTDNDLKEEKVIDRNKLLTEAVNNICDNCKSCEVKAEDTNTKEKMTIRSNYCKDGDGYIQVDLYNSSNEYVESCKLKHPTDSCILPFPLKVTSEPVCGCL